jgi:hypothetical protein
MRIKIYCNINGFNVDCRRISNSEDVARWIRAGHWHVLTFHGIGAEHDGWAPITLEQFALQMAELAKYWNAGAIEVVTFKEGAARVSLGD